MLRLTTADFLSFRKGAEVKGLRSEGADTAIGISPLEWIQQYVATQAKRIMDTYPEQTVKETAYQLGFPTTANFCRYFKRATGVYPQEYKEKGDSQLTIHNLGWRDGGKV